MNNINIKTNQFQIKEYTPSDNSRKKYLEIETGKGDDNIEIKRSDDGKQFLIKINDQFMRVNAKNISKIIVSGGDGNDLIDIDVKRKNKSGFEPTVVAFGGKGSDTISVRGGGSNGGIEVSGDATIIRGKSEGKELFGVRTESDEKDVINISDSKGYTNIISHKGNKDTLFFKGELITDKKDNKKIEFSNLDVGEQVYLKKKWVTVKHNKNLKAFGE